MGTEIFDQRFEDVIYFGALGTEGRRQNKEDLTGNLERGAAHIPIFLQKLGSELVASLQDEDWARGLTICNQIELATSTLTCERQMQFWANYVGETCAYLRHIKTIAGKSN